MSIHTVSSLFIEKQAMFGAYPTPINVIELVEWNVDIIVNLTCSTEKNVKPYTVPSSVELISFPIPDRSIPHDLERFTALVLYLKSMLDAKKKIYIHCKAGHGRSGVLVACLLCYHLKLTPLQSIEKTNEYHATRREMKDRWRAIGSPQTVEQKQFIKHMFQQHVLCETSPLIAIDINSLPTEAYLEEFLIQTHLGNIIGEDGQALEQLRRQLFADRYPFFDFVNSSNNNTGK